MSRVYLDHNATTPLREEARVAICAAMDVVGNPSSVHAEGRAAKALVERARGQVADLVGCLPSQVVFTGSATEAAALAVSQKARYGDVFRAMATEHDCFLAWDDGEGLSPMIGRDGALDVGGTDAFFDYVKGLAGLDWAAERDSVALIAISGANSETGVMAPNGEVMGDGAISASRAGTVPYGVVCDITQMAGKVPVRYGDRRPSFMVLSAHKLGGPKGVGALINFTAQDPVALLRGGGQEMGRRSGTENVIGIAGFGAAAEAAGRDVAAGRWEEIEQFRNILELALEASAKKTIFVGKDSCRLPNTSCFATPGWKGETQVMQMDLAGFAISAGSACSSGKVRASKVLRALGYDDETAASAVRVSLGLETREDDVLRFAEAWLAKEQKFRARAA